MTVKRLRTLIETLPDDTEIYVREEDMPGYKLANSIGVWPVVHGMGGSEKVMRPHSTQRYEHGLFIE